MYLRLHGTLGDNYALREQRGGHHVFPFPYKKGKPKLAFPYPNATPSRLYTDSCSVRAQLQVSWLLCGRHTGAICLHSFVTFCRTVVPYLLLSTAVDAEIAAFDPDLNPVSPFVSQISEFR